MNYRHAFHAGNFADVFKHAVLTRLLVLLMRKETPLRFIDTHAGSGRYDLDERCRATLAGMARRRRATPEGAPAGRGREIARALSEAIGPFDEAGAPAPLSRLAGARAGPASREDRLALCEAHPEDREQLWARSGATPRLSIVCTDGYVALNA